ncbi:phage tail protein [Streptomyces shenzhenensis]|uniref:phage tail protein n=1 Tax=Streptomyces shenzhenensis TaxID=943815 RepID=UPI0036AD614B
MAGDDVTITVSVNNQTVAGFRDINGQLRTLDGRFATASGSVQRSSSRMQGALLDVKGALLSLAPAAVPVAASLAPVVAQTGAATLALTAFGAALVPQVMNLTHASEAQTKYSDAVGKYGARSKQAIEAQTALAETMAGMPQATQRAAAGYQVLKDKFTSWSDSTAKFTMAPVEKSFAVLGGILPKLTPMVEGAGTQLDRLMTLAGGGVNTAAFDTLSKKVSDYSTSVLQGAIDKTIHFARVLSEGKANGPIASFMDYARAQGPAVRELLTNLSEAVSNLLEGASEAGPGLLNVVNALAKLAASVPPELIGNLMSVYAAFKLIKLAGAGVGAIAGGFGTLAARVTALRVAAVAAGGGIAGLQTALGSLSTGGKATVALGVVGALVAVMHELSDNKGPVAVDALSSSLNTLASTGKVTGALKTNLDDIAASIAMVSKGASDNKLAQLTSDFGTFVGISTGPGISTARKNVDAWDKSMANLVRGGHTKEAAAQYEILKKAWAAGGGDLNRLGKFTNDYKAALADQAFEQKMAAQSMGLFGSAAQDAQVKLDAQKRSADGLRQSVQALNDVNRKGLGGMIGFEAAVDAAAKAAKKNADALSMTNGVLNLGSEKARNAASALQDLADKTDSAAASARESGSSWETVNGIYERGRAALVKNAQAMGLTKSQAAQLADQILRIPDKKSTKLEMRTEDAVSGLNSVISAMRKTPNSKSVTVKALTSDAVSLLRDLGFKVTKLKDGRFKVTAETANAKSNIAAVQRARDRLKDKTITLSARDRASAAARAIQRAIAGLRNKTVTITTVRATIATYSTSGRPVTGQGGVSKYATGGPIIGGSGTKDDVPLLAMGGEFIINKEQTRKYRSLLEAINEDRLPRFAKGGVTKAEAQARKEAWPNLTISHFGQMAGRQRSEFGSALGRPESVNALVDALNSWRGTIMRATHGSTENRLLKQLDSTGKKLLSYEKQLTSVNKSLESAKNKLNDLKSAASQLASSVKSGILSASNITRGAGGEAPVTKASVMAGLVQSRDKATSFAAALKQLQKKGLRGDLIQQIAEAGIEGGGLETASALLGASSSEIKSINSLQHQIAAAGNSAGKTTSDAVYAAQIKAQEALVKKLDKQQDKLIKAMDKLAKSMEKSIEKAFGKKAAGGIVGAAASGGLRSGLTMVGEQGFELLDLPAGSRVWSNPDSRRKVAAAQAPWASMLSVPRRGSAASRGVAVSGGGVGGRPIVLHVSIGAREFGQLWVDTGRREVRAKGGLKATLGGMD